MDLRHLTLQGVGRYLYFANWDFLITTLGFSPTRAEKTFEIIINKFGSDEQDQIRENIKSILSKKEGLIDKRIENSVEKSVVQIEKRLERECSKLNSRLDSILEKITTYEKIKRLEKADSERRAAA